jgi:hypothetical protein
VCEKKVVVPPLLPPSSLQANATFNRHRGKKKRKSYDARCTREAPGTKCVVVSFGLRLGKALFESVYVPDHMCHIDFFG